MLQLKSRLENQLQANWGRRTAHSLTLLNVRFKNPVVRVRDVEEGCNLSPKAAGDLIQSFETAGILKELTGQSRNRIFVFEDYLNLFK